MSDILLADKRRMKIVELGGAKGLVNMLAGAKDDKTRKHALKALVAISKSGQSGLQCSLFLSHVHIAMVNIDFLSRHTLYSIGNFSITQDKLSCSFCCYCSDYKFVFG